MFHPPVIWTLFHVHHQKDIKQDAEYQFGTWEMEKKCGMCVPAAWGWYEPGSGVSTPGSLPVFREHDAFFAFLVCFLALRVNLERQPFLKM